MKFLASQIHASHLFRGDVDADGIDALVDLRFDFEPCFGRGGSAQGNDNFMADVALSWPIRTDVTEHPVFDLFPFTDSGRKMTNRYFHAEFVRQSL